MDRYANGSVKIKPGRPEWRHIIVTREEIEAGSERPPIVARKKPSEPRRKPQPKPKPEPKWKRLIDQSRAMVATGQIWAPEVTDLILSLAGELEAAQTLFANDHAPSQSER